MKRLFEQVRANKRTTRGRMELVRANKRTTRGRMDLPGGRVVESNHRRVGVNLLPVLLLQQVTVSTINDSSASVMKSPINGKIIFFAKS